MAKLDPLARSRDFKRRGHPNRGHGADMVDLLMGQPPPSRSTAIQVEVTPPAEAQTIGEFFLLRRDGQRDGVAAGMTDQRGNPVIVELGQADDGSIDPILAEQFGLDSTPEGIAMAGDYAYVTSPSSAWLEKRDKHTGTRDTVTPYFHPPIFDSYTVQLGTGTAGAGTAPLAFNNPSKVAVRADGILLVADTTNNRVIAVNADGTFNKIVVAVASNANCVAADPTGDTFYIGLTGGTVVRYSWNGNPANVANLLWTSAALGAVPTDIDSDGTHIYIAFQAGNSVLKRLCSTGAAVLTLTTGVGTGNRQVTGPTGVVVDSLYVYIAENGGARVQKLLKADGSYITQWTPVAAGLAVFNNLWGIGIHPITGHIFTTEYGADRAYEWTASGLFQRKYQAVSGTGAQQWGTPTDITFNAAGTVAYVADQSGSNRVHKYVTTPLAWEPHGVDVDEDTGRVYVTDETDRVHILSSANVLVATFGSSGSGAGQLLNPRGIAYNPTTGKIYVADAGNDRINRYNGIGTFELSWGSTGDSDLELDTPVGIDIDDSGAVYVVDSGNHRIVKFDADGTFLAKFGSVTPRKTWLQVTTHGTTGAGTSPNFNEPRQIARDSGDNIYIADTVNNRLVKLDGTGAYLTAIAGLTGITGVCVSPTDDTIYVAYGTTLRKYSAALAVVWTSAGWAGLTHCTTDGTTLWLTYAAGNFVFYALCSTGAYQGNVASFGTGPGQVTSPYGVVVSDGFVYVSDTGNDRVQKWTTGNVYVTSFPVEGNESGGVLTSPVAVGINVTNDGDLMVADGGTGHIILIDKDDGTEILRFASLGAPHGTLMDSGGYIWVSDETIDTLRVFDETYAVSPGSADGDFNNPRDLAIDPLGRFWVSDADNNRIQIFDKDFAFLGKAGTIGSLSGYLWSPSGIAADDEGRIFIAEVLNDRVSRVAPPDTSFPLLIEGEGLNDVLRWNGLFWTNSPGGEYLIGSAEPVNSSELIADGIFSTEFDEYRISGYVNLSVAASALYFRLRAAGVELVGVGYYNEMFTWTQVAASGAAASAAVGQFYLIWPIAGGTANVGFEAVIKNPMRLLGKAFRSITTGVYAGVDWRTIDIGGYNSIATAHDGCRIFPSSGLMATGWIDIFGRTT